MTGLFEHLDLKELEQCLEEVKNRMISIIEGYFNLHGAKPVCMSGTEEEPFIYIGNAAEEDDRYIYALDPIGPTSRQDPDDLEEEEKLHSYSDYPIDVLQIWVRKIEALEKAS